MSERHWIAVGVGCLVAWLTDQGPPRVFRMRVKLGGQYITTTLTLPEPTK